ncbi:MAG: NADH-quinone oxidoreductase subunit L, partial [Rhodoferax sp.]|nr:NADH-quinone oxidoreductase subunit L [Pseudorhodobacter sp.]
THAFFKAMLFLGAGSVIHAMHHEQDMRNYGGLRKKIPLTFTAMLIGTLAITGVGIPLTEIGFAGFLSKDAVIEVAYAGSSYAFTLLVIAAFMTSFYSWRLIFLTFFGKPRGDHHAYDHAHESPKTMLVPLGVLALGAVFSGMIWYNSFFGEEEKLRDWFGMEAAQAEEATAEATTAEAAPAADATAEAAPAADATTEAAPATDATVDAAPAETVAPAEATPAIAGTAPKGAIFMGPDNHIIHEAHQSPTWVKLSPFIAMILGLGLAIQFYLLRPDLPGKLAAQQRPLYLFFLNKWYFDEIYDFLFVRPAKALGAFLWKRGDGNVIDGTLNGVAMGVIPMLTRLAGRAQSGYIFTYAFAMVLGIGALITWMTLGGAH